MSNTEALTPRKIPTWFKSLNASSLLLLHADDENKPGLSVVEIGVSCSKLPKVCKIAGSKSHSGMNKCNPLVAMYGFQRGEYVYLEQTETIRNQCNPKFHSYFRVAYDASNPARLNEKVQFSVYSTDTLWVFERDRLGSMEVKFGDLLQNQTMRVALTHGVRGFIDQELQNCGSHIDISVTTPSPEDLLSDHAEAAVAAGNKHEAANLIHMIAGKLEDLLEEWSNEVVKDSKASEKHLVKSEALRKALADTHQVMRAVKEQKKHTPSSTPFGSPTKGQGGTATQTAEEEYTYITLTRNLAPGVSQTDFGAPSTQAALVSAIAPVADVDPARLELCKVQRIKQANGQKGVQFECRILPPTILISDDGSPVKDSASAIQSIAKQWGQCDSPLNSIPIVQAVFAPVVAGEMGLPPAVEIKYKEVTGSNAGAGENAGGGVEEENVPDLGVLDLNELTHVTAHVQNLSQRCATMFETLQGRSKTKVRTNAEKQLVAGLQAAILQMNVLTASVCGEDGLHLLNSGDTKAAKALQQIRKHCELLFAVLTTGNALKINSRKNSETVGAEALPGGLDPAAQVNAQVDAEVMALAEYLHIVPAMLLSHDKLRSITPASQSAALLCTYTTLTPIVEAMLTTLKSKKGSDDDARLKVEVIKACETMLRCAANPARTQEHTFAALTALSSSCYQLDSELCYQAEKEDEVGDAAMYRQDIRVSIRDLFDEIATEQSTSKSVLNAVIVEKVKVLSQLIGSDGSLQSMASLMVDGVDEEAQRRMEKQDGERMHALEELLSVLREVKPQVYSDQNKVHTAHVRKGLTQHLLQLNSTAAGNEGLPLTKSIAIQVGDYFTSDSKLKSAKGAQLQVYAQEVMQRISKHAWLGVEVMTRRNGDVVVLRIRRGSPAKMARIQQFDVILKVDNQPLYNGDDIGKILLNHRPGDDMTLIVRQDDYMANNPYLRSSLFNAGSPEKAMKLRSVAIKCCTKYLSVKSVQRIESIALGQFDESFADESEWLMNLKLPNKQPLSRRKTSSKRDDKPRRSSLTSTTSSKSTSSQSSRTGTPNSKASSTKSNRAVRLMSAKSSSTTSNPTLNLALRFSTALTPTKGTKRDIATSAASSVASSVVSTPVAKVVKKKSAKSADRITSTKKSESVRGGF